MKSAQKRSENMSSEVKTKRILPCGRRQDVAGDVLNPAVGAELDGADERVRHEQHEQQERSDREIGLDADDQQQDEGDRPGEHAPGRRGEERVAGEEREDAAQLILEEQADQEARDQRAEDAHFVQHLADAEALGRRLGLREVLAEERDAVERGRHEEQPELNLPAHVHALAENPADEAAEHEAGRPARMQDVQVMRAVAAERASRRAGWRRLRACRWPGRRRTCRCRETGRPWSAPAPWSRQT